MTATRTRACTTLASSKLPTDSRRCSSPAVRSRLLTISCASRRPTRPLWKKTPWTSTRGDSPPPAGSVAASPTSAPLDAEHNRQHARQRLAMPVMTVGGTASFGAALRDQVAPLVEHHRHEMIEDCGHYLAEEQPQRLTELLLDFIGDGTEAQ